MIRKYLYLVLAVTLFAGIGAAARATWKAGYTAAQAEAAVELQRQLEVAHAEWERASAIAREQILNEIRIQERTRMVEQAIPEVVAGLPDQCRDLGADVMRLFNNAISDDGAANVTGSP